MDLTWTIFINLEYNCVTCTKCTITSRRSKCVISQPIFCNKSYRCVARCWRQSLNIYLLLLLQSNLQLVHQVRCIQNLFLLNDEPCVCAVIVPVISHCNVLGVTAVPSVTFAIILCPLCMLLGTNLYT